ncbi:hypothetical protein Scep_002473 [Stephania cephalantha]|uniref:Staygreen protein domain-containing protein n=1 Tax=Stephania cephalantha TaxID=152367 RepID=A0AAP0LBH5_9MAGN
MACSCFPSSSTASPKRGFFTDHNKKLFSFSTWKKRPSPVLVASIAERRDSYNPLVFQAARLLGPPARFDASKLKVVHMGDEYGKGVIPRTYSLSHCDLTANLTLAVSNAISIDQLKGYYKNDDVVAEWKKVEEGICLVIHCHVSGPYALPDLVAEFRYHIFTKELPLVLKAVLHGDSILFKEHPELIDAVVWVYFHSTSKKYNHVECWGPLMDASQESLVMMWLHVVICVDEVDYGNKETFYYALNGNTTLVLSASPSLEPLAL